MDNFRVNQEEFYFWDEMWNEKTKKDENKKTTSKDGVEDTPLEP